MSNDYNLMDYLTVLR